MKKIFICLLILLFTHTALEAQSDILQRFLPSLQQIRTKRAPLFTLPPLPKVNIRKASVTDFNNAVDFNNMGLDDMKAGDLLSAKQKFSKACNLAPSEKGFWSNYLLALNKLPNKKKKAIQVARIILALDPKESQAAYIAGIIYLNDFKNHTKALQYLTYAHMISPDDANIAIALATALRSSGYKDDAFELLKKYAHQIKNDPYPFYLLGLQYLKKNNFNAAIRSLKTSASMDNKGYAHEAYIRARYYAGQLEGLAQDCRNTLNRFPSIINKGSLTRIFFSITPQNYKLVETITLKITDARALDKLAFLVKIPPNISGHQKVKLLKAQLLCNGSIADIKPVGHELDGRLRFATKHNFISHTTRLRLTYQILTTPWLGSRSKSAFSSYPDIRILKKDKNLSLSHPMLKLLSERIKQMDGNYVQNATKAVVRGLEYKENFEDHSVKWIFSNPKNCDCTEFARLLASLCLENNIPARVVTGFLVKQDLIDKSTSIGHAWCEVYFKSVGWFPIDPTLQSTMHWAYFGNMLSDQIIFDYMEPKSNPRVSVDFISTSTDVNVNITDSYHISLFN